MNFINPICCGGGHICPIATLNANISELILTEDFILLDFDLTPIWQFLGKFQGSMIEDKENIPTLILALSILVAKSEFLNLNNSELWSDNEV